MNLEERTKGLQLLQEANAHWGALASYREERRRCKDYTYGRQWKDTISVDGQKITEEEYIISQGNIPLKNNLIRKIVRNVLGVYHNRYDLPGIKELHLDETAANFAMVEKIRSSQQRDNLQELYSRTMEEFLIGGLAVCRKRVTKDVAGERRVTTCHVEPESFFFDSGMRDTRCPDVAAVGEIHTVGFPVLTSRFASRPEDIRLFERIYGRENKRCSVTEYWKKEVKYYWLCHDRRRGFRFRSDTRPKESHVESIWMHEEVWRYYFIAPDGTILLEGESPYAHGANPYIFRAYPLIDGEIHSFVSDCIDQQRYINRLITLYDWIMRASAKGVLLFPEGAVPEGVEIEEIADEWSKFNGVIIFRPKAGMPLPQQISSNATNIGITDLLNVQLKMMEDVSGVNSALQGNLSGGAVSGTLYDMQVRYSLTGLLDLLESFGSFMRDSSMWEVGVF